MKNLVAGLLLTAVLSACGNGPIFRVDDDLYDWVKAPSAVDPASDYTPLLEGQTVRFALDPGNKHSALVTGDDWRLGQTYLMGFDVRFERLPGGNTPIVLSRLVRTGAASPVEIASVQVDQRRGVTVMGRECIKSPELGNWHRVEMRMKMSNGDTGYLEVFCDRKPIWAMTKIRTTFAPGCRLSEGCDSDVPKPVGYEWRNGLMMDQKAGTSVVAYMRKLHYRLVFYVPNRAGNL
ncbi:MAG: hypothetical protein AAF665_08275 [Pseudomonadota bacterium]